MFNSLVGRMEHVSRGLEIQDVESLGGYTKNHDANVEYKKSKMFHSLALCGNLLQ